TSEPPIPPELVLPENKSTVYTSTPVFSWKLTSDPDPDGYITSYKISGYMDELKTQVAFSSAPLTASTTFWQVLTQLLPETSYYWEVSATDNEGFVSTSTLWQFFVYDYQPPAAITDLRASSGQFEGTVELVWTTTGDNNSTGNIQNGFYEIRYTTGSQHLWIESPWAIIQSTSVLQGTSVKTNITGLIPGNTYYFWVRIADEISNWSSISNKATAEASIDKIPPAPVTKLQALSTQTTYQIKLVWTVTGDDEYSGNFVDGYYEIAYSTFPILSYSDYLLTNRTTYQLNLSANTSMQFFVKGLSPDIIYYFVVRLADEQQNWSELSDCVSAQTGDFTPPILPPNFYAIPFNKQQRIELGWIAPSDPDYAKSIIVVNTSTFPKTISDGNILFYGSTPPSEQKVIYHTPLLNRTTYYYSLFAYDINNNTSAPRYASALLWDPVSPDVPVGAMLTISTAPNTYTLSWEEPYYNSDKTPIDDLSKYKIYQAYSYTGPYEYLLSVSSDTTTASICVSDLSRTYYFKVVAVDFGGNESESALVVDTNGNLIVSADDGSLSRVIIPQSASYGLYAKTNNSKRSYLPKLIRESISNEMKNTVRIYKFVITDKDKTIDNYKFSDAVTLVLQFAIIDDKIENINLSKKYMKDLSIWMKTVEWISLPSTVNMWIQTVQANISHTSLYKIGRAFKYDSFTLLQIYPAKIFTPNGDGVNDTINFVIENPNNATVSGEIYTLDSTYISRLNLTSQDSILSWDGTNISGKPCPAGIYIYQIQAENKTYHGTILLVR
ncbi:MAG: hypothetical protein QME68_04005, partial [Elusimicrobiota bacterium]|nr:hypothetical protein [Elusimicrobiota bacterium]